MFDALENPPPDPILAVSVAFRADPRPHKVDLGVGVYRDQQGQTPVFAAVKQAERALWEQQKSKTYLGSAGDREFNHQLVQLTLADVVSSDRVASLQSVGGTGAVRVLLELAQLANPHVTVWLPRPTWPNHHAIASRLGLNVNSYDLAPPLTDCIVRDDWPAVFAKARRGDVLVVHGCCHNPTGVDPTPDQWLGLANWCVHSGMVPLIDLAYLGFGDDLLRDSQGIRYLAQRVPELMLAVSCSKNFGLYRERTGCAIAVVDRPVRRDTTEASLSALVRCNYSMPPDHGAAVVGSILANEDWRQSWQQELAAINDRIGSLRRDLAVALRRISNSDRFDALTRQRGMFSLLGASLEQVDKLKQEHAIYVAGGGRINIAGLPSNRIDEIAQALVTVGL